MIDLPSPPKGPRPEDLSDPPRDFDLLVIFADGRTTAALVVCVVCIILAVGITIYGLTRPLPPYDDRHREY